MVLPIKYVNGKYIYGKYVYGKYDNGKYIHNKYINIKYVHDKYIHGKYDHGVSTMVALKCILLWFRFFYSYHSMYCFRQRVYCAEEKEDVLLCNGTTRRGY